MSEREPDEQVLVRYVLGTLPEEQVAGVEQEILRDEARHEQVLAVEDDLLHEYAHGALPPEQRRQLETRLLRTPEGRWRLERAQALLGALAGAPRRRQWHWLAAAAAVLLAVGAGWLAYRMRAPGVETAGAPSAPPTVMPSAAPGVASPTPTATDSPTLVPPTAVVALALSPGLARGEGGPVRVTLVPRVVALRLTLRLPTGAPRPPYRAVLLSVDGAELWSHDGLASRDRTVVVDIPAGSLAEADYELVLFAGPKARPTEAADYAFGVLRE